MKGIIWFNYHFIIKLVFKDDGDDEVRIPEGPANTAFSFGGFDGPMWSPYRNLYPGKHRIFQHILGVPKPLASGHIEFHVTISTLERSESIINALRQGLSKYVYQIEMIKKDPDRNLGIL